MQYLSYFIIDFVSLFNTCHIHNKFLSRFVIINLKFVKLSLFVTFSNKFCQKDPKRVFEVFLSHFVIKTVFTKDLDSIQIFGQICYLDYFEYAELDGDVPFFFFKQEIPSLGKFGRKNRNCMYNLKYWN